MKIYTATEEKIKKNNKIKIRIRYLRCRFAPEKHDRLKTVSGPHTNALCTAS